MWTAVLGTGIVGQTLAGKLVGLGHDVVVGTRDPGASLKGESPFVTWHQQHAQVGVLALHDAAAHGELVINATSGTGSLAALEAAGAALDGKVLIDVSNPLDFSGGFPPILSVANTDSIAEQIQRAHPAARVVKSLNTMTAQVMVEPGRVPGEHHVFVAGDDADARATVTSLLGEMGWPEDRVLDLGGLRAARGLEMWLPLWLSLMQNLGTPDFNIEVRRA
jgi:predicted dinucleotide-binding enzyme